MSEAAEERLDALIRLWARERRATAARFAEERDALPLEERVDRGLALTGLDLDETDAVAGGRTLLLFATPPGIDLDNVRIRHGSPAVLWWESPDDPDAVHGVVHRRGPRLGLVVDGDVPERVEDGGLSLDREAPEQTFDRGDRALAAVRGAKEREPLGRLREMLYGEARPRFGAAAPPPFLDEALEDAQRDAVALALRAEDVALIHGPPGTGKTRTLVEVVRQAVARGERVLVSAASNTAVDNLAERLADAGVEVVRLGHPARIAPAVEARSLDALMEGSPEHKLARGWLREANALRRKAHIRFARGSLGYRERRAQLGEAYRLQKDARRQLAGVQARILARCPVVCATAAGADVRLLEDATFDLVVLDEATQAPDPLALVALSRAPRAVLAGDPCQLPPTVIDREAERGALGRTVFEHLAERQPEAVRMLEVQHRMHEALMAFPSAQTYGGRLRAAPSVAAHVLEDLPGVVADPLRPGPFVFLDTAGKGWDEERSVDDPSTRNPGQAERTAREVRRLTGRGLAPTELAVITPYEAQARMLRGLLGPERAAGLEIGTVDGFQGREKEAVVVDLVRSNPDGEVGFLADVRRMNVALTRARRFLLVIGDSATLGGHGYYGALLAPAEASGSYLSAWNDDGTWGE